MHLFTKRPADGESPAPRRAGWRELALAMLGAVTIGVATLSVVVSYRILEGTFGVWAYAIVAALDTLWVIFQLAEILAGNNRQRALRARVAGIVLTIVLTAIPTVDLAMTVSAAGHFEMAVVLTPVAIALTKLGWVVALPALGRRVSPETRERLANERQRVADRLEVMVAEAAHRAELLAVAARLETEVAEAETDYRVAVLKSQQKTTQKLREQGVATEKVTAEPLPASVTAIRLPDLDTWEPTALPGTASARAVTQVSAPALPSGTDGGTGGGTPAVPQDVPAAQAPDLSYLAAVAGVPVPVPGVPLEDDQMAVVLRYLRYDDDPPASYRQARDQYRAHGYIGSEERVRQVWRQVVAQEPAASAEGVSVPGDEDGADDDEESSSSSPQADQ
ncbi:hypothetical protein ACF1CG_36930 [Streptomyces sp. NPDC014773]|uniref:hypothetical protein n=1 Tax=Streptomyces sp. NPDC014773 TaxID=3364908 RepID=UPI0036F541F3